MLLASKAHQLRRNMLPQTAAAAEAASSNGRTRRAPSSPSSADEFCRGIAQAGISMVSANLRMLSCALCTRCAFVGTDLSFSSSRWSSFCILGNCKASMRDLVTKSTSPGLHAALAASTPCKYSGRFKRKSGNGRGTAEAISGPEARPTSKPSAAAAAPAAAAVAKSEPLETEVSPCSRDGEPARSRAACWVLEGTPRCAAGSATKATESAAAAAKAPTNATASTERTMGDASGR
mmetsp:Transcript_77348/g.195327  ORF Transcript_77348/g.195327 Transcript_77348/m.195327 type:complete len:235 (-) Transcript_77348:26-730(-)